MKNWAYHLQQNYGIDLVTISTLPQKYLMSHITILSSTVKCHHSSYPHFYSKKLLVFRQNGKMSLPKLHGKGVNL